MCINNRFQSSKGIVRTCIHGRITVVYLMNLEGIEDSGEKQEAIIFNLIFILVCEVLILVHTTNLTLII